MGLEPTTTGITILDFSFTLFLSGYRWNRFDHFTGETSPLPSLHIYDGLAQQQKDE